jgi:hypothetical protein
MKNDKAVGFSDFYFSKFSKLKKLNQIDRFLMNRQNWSGPILPIFVNISIHALLFGNDGIKTRCQVLSPLAMEPPVTPEQVVAPFPIPVIIATAKKAWACSVT